MSVTKCTIVGAIAYPISSVCIEGVGHCQILDRIEYKGKEYFIIGCKDNIIINKDEETEKRYASQLGLLDYNACVEDEKDPEKIISYTELPAITYLRKASGKDMGDLRSVDASLDSSGKYVGFCVRTLLTKDKTTVNTVTFTYYLSDKIMRIFSKSTSGVAADISSYIQSGDIQKTFSRPLSTVGAYPNMIQGYDSEYPI